MSDRLWIVLPCAGSGARFSAAGAVAKQYALLGERTVLTVVLERMLELDPVRIVLVVAEGTTRGTRACRPRRAAAWSVQPVVQSARRPC